MHSYLETEADAQADRMARVAAIHDTSATAAAIEHMRLTGERPDGAFDDRPLPEREQLREASTAIMRAVLAAFQGTRLADYTGELASAFVDQAHRLAERTDRRAATFALKAHELCREQDGTEIKTSELESAQDERDELAERAKVFHLLRGCMSRALKAETGTQWSSPGGSQPATAVTAAVISQGDYYKARRLEAEDHAQPDAPRVYFALNRKAEICDPQGIKSPFRTADELVTVSRIVWAKLDALRHAQPHMVLVHGGEKILTAWADDRNIPQHIIRPAWNGGANTVAALMKRNDQVLRLPTLYAVVGYPMDSGPLLKLFQKGTEEVQRRRSFGKRLAVKAADLVAEVAAMRAAQDAQH
jgi:hypothetical protein